MALVRQARLEGRMAMNNKAAVVMIVRQEGLAHPAKIVAVLLIKWSEGIYTSVDE